MTWCGWHGFGRIENPILSVRNGFLYGSELSARPCRYLARQRACRPVVDCAVSTISSSTGPRTCYGGRCCLPRVSARNREGEAARIVLCLTRTITSVWELRVLRNRIRQESSNQQTSLPARESYRRPDPALRAFPTKKSTTGAASAFEVSQADQASA